MAAGVPTAMLPAVLTALAEALTDSPHLEFVLGWVHALCVSHGAHNSTHLSIFSIFTTSEV